MPLDNTPASGENHIPEAIRRQSIRADELARPVTLALLFFGNIFAGEVLLVVASAMILAHLGFLSGLARSFPLGIFAFNLIIGVIQALVFTLLTIAYLITPTQETSEH